MTALLYRYNIKRAQLIRFIFAEFLIMAVAIVMIYNISWDHIIGKRIDTCSSIIETSGAMFGDYAADAATASAEQLKEELDETVWVTEDGVNYRTGPNTSYAAAGVLDEYKSVYRTGVTYKKVICVMFWIAVIMVAFVFNAYRRDNMFKYIVFALYVFVSAFLSVDMIFDWTGLFLKAPGADLKGALKYTVRILYAIAAAALLLIVMGLIITYPDVLIREAGGK